MRRRVEYIEGHTLLHRMHPLLKLAWVISLSITIFILPSPWFATVMLLLLWVGLQMSKGPTIQLVGLRLLLLTSLLLAVVQLIFIRSGVVWLQLGRLSITQDGARMAVYVAGRFLCIVLLSYLFVLTTHPGDLAYALMQAGLPYRYGFALITALRMVPMFQIEAQTIYRAQQARGFRLDRGGLRGAAEAIRRMLMPLLVSALGKADALAVSMEGRGFGRYARRTYLRRVKMGAGDFLGLVTLGLWMIALVAFTALD